MSGNKQIGWSQESTLLQGISKQLERLAGIISSLGGGGGGTVLSVTGDLVNNTDPTNPVVGRGFLEYTALVNQSGTGVPVLTVLVNTMGITLTPTRNTVGEYTFTPSSNILDLAKTTIDISPVKFSSVAAGKASYTIEHAANSFFKVYTHQAGASTWSQTDNNFRNNKLEIRIYP